MIRPCLTFLFSLALAAACGGDDEHTPGQPDAAPAADAAPPDECTCIALGVDYTNGVGTAAAFGLPSLTVTPNLAPGAVSGDPVLRFAGGKVYVVNRFGFDQITILEPSDWSVDEQFSVGMNFNPQDVAIAGGKAYVVGLGAAEVRIFDLADTAAAPSVVALPTRTEDADSNPDAVSIAVAGGKAYVALQHLEDFMPAFAGEIIVIDTATDQITGSFLLANQNPTNLLRVSGATIYAGTTPDFTPMTGCLEAIETDGMPSAACLADAAALGGFVTGIAPADDGSVWVAVAQSFTASNLLNVSATGTVGATSLTPAGQQPQDVATCGKYLVMSDGSLAGSGGGLRVYDTAAGSELTTQVIDVGLPPAFASGIACFPAP